MAVQSVSATSNKAQPPKTNADDAKKFEQSVAKANTKPQATSSAAGAASASAGGGKAPAANASASGAGAASANGGKAPAANASGSGAASASANGGKAPAANASGSGAGSASANGGKTPAASASGSGAASASASGSGFHSSSSLLDGRNPWAPRAEIDKQVLSNAKQWYAQVRIAGELARSRGQPSWAKIYISAYNGGPGALMTVDQANNPITVVPSVQGQTRNSFYVHARGGPKTGVSGEGLGLPEVWYNGHNRAYFIAGLYFSRSNVRGSTTPPPPEFEAGRTW